MNESSENMNSRIEKGIINRILTYMGISMLFGAIFLVYTFSVLKFLFNDSGFVNSGIFRE